MRRRQLGGVLDADDPLVGRHRAQHRRQQGRLARAGAAGHQERQPGGDDLVDEFRGRRRDGTGRDQARPGPAWPAAAPAATGRCRPRQPAAAPHAAGPRTARRPHRSAARPPTAARRRAAGRRPAPAAAPAAGRRLRRRTESSVRRRPFPSSTHTASGAVTSTSVVPVRAQQWLEDPGAGQLGLQYPKVAQHLGVAEHSAGFGADRVGHHAWGAAAPDSAASRSRTRSISEPLMPPGLRAGRRTHRQHRKHSAGRRRQRGAPPQPQSAAFQLLGQPRVRPHRGQQRQAAMRPPRRRAGRPATDPAPPGRRWD